MYIKEYILYNPKGVTQGAFIRSLLVTAVFLLIKYSCCSSWIFESTGLQEKQKEIVKHFIICLFRCPITVIYQQSLIENNGWMWRLIDFWLLREVACVDSNLGIKTLIQTIWLFWFVIYLISTIKLYKFLTYSLNLWHVVY